VLIQDQLVALAVVRGEQESRLLWLQFDPLTGTVLAERPLARLRESWWQQRSCQVQALSDGLLIACGGSVLRADLSGELRWARQQTWVPPALDRNWMVQAQLPPIVAGDCATLVQPGVQAVVSLQLDCGRLDWQRVLPGVQRLLGATADYVIAQTDEGLVALGRDSGEPAWRFDAQGLLDAHAVGDDAILVARTQRGPENNQLGVLLVWLDGQTGQPRARTQLAALAHEQPRLGPLFGGGGKWWAFSGRGVGEPTRDLLELAPSAAAEPIAPPAAQKGDGSHFP
jgi:outer membrane protein assembly factor BamB